MKVFMATEFDGSMTLKIEADSGDWIALRGERCDDAMPVYGMKLHDEGQEHLETWIQRLGAVRILE